MCDSLSKKVGKWYCASLALALSITNRFMFKHKQIIKEWSMILLRFLLVLQMLTIRMQRQNIRLEQDKRHWRLLLCLHVKERWSCFSAPAIFLFQAFHAIGSTSLSTFPLSPFYVPMLFKWTRKTCLLSLLVFLF